MDIDSRVERALERGGRTVRPDVPAALLDVRRRARRRTTRRRTAMVGAVVGVALVAGVLARIAAPGSDASPSPVGPPRETGTPGSVSLTLVREVSADSLGLRKLLSAAVGPDGRVYVTDTSQRVAELSPDLEVVRTWGESGEGPGRFRFVQGSLTVGPDGSVYVADTGNFRVQVFTPDGRFVRSIGEFGNGPGQFTWPFDVAVDADGDLYVADDKEQTLAKLSPSGRQLWRRGGLTEADERLQGHQHFSMVDAEQRLVTSNDDRGLVMLLGADGSVVHTLTPGALGDDGVCDATVDAAGHYFLTSCSGRSGVQVYDADGALLGDWEGPGLVQSPRWSTDGRGYAVASDGGVVEVQVASD